MEEQFSSWLERNKPKSQRHYISGYRTINSLLENNNLQKLKLWNSSNWESNLQSLSKIEKFKNLNSTGNNILTAALSNLKKFIMSEDIKQDPPALPFKNFCWRWASTGIASHLNKPNHIRPLLDAILINGNGENNYTHSFKELLERICLKKYKLSEEDAERLIKKNKTSNTGEPVTVIENSAKYWSHLSLLSEVGKNAKVSELGIEYLTGNLPQTKFVEKIIQDYTLPNLETYTDSEELQEWKNKKLEIKPFKIIIEIFAEFQRVQLVNNEQYLTEEDLKKIVIPFSAIYKKSRIKELTEHVVNNRKNSDLYYQWPDCYSHLIDDKGERMINEFLYFLECFGFLHSESEKVRENNKRYYATSVLQELLIKSEVLIETVNRDIATEVIPTKFDVENFATDLENTGLSFDRKIIDRFITSLLTKKFLILSGVSGSGKTKLAQAFASWICKTNDQFEIVPVGADWTNKEHLLGYYDSINEKYVSQPTLSLILEAQENENKPYFLILDEMNLSHVERYFSDFLSVIESGGNIHLHDSAKIDENIPRCINKLPNNLFVVGTVNMDETTYMFSPKVLDRANVIEFRVKETEFDAFIKYPKNINLHLLSGKGKNSAENFKTLSCQNPNNAFEDEELEAFQKELNELFKIFQNNGWDFGFRIGYEVSRYIKFHTIISEDNEWKKGLDAQIVQKLMPKLNGSVSRLSGILKSLSLFCTEEFGDSEVKANVIEEKVQSTAAINPVQLYEDKKDETSFPLTFEKTYRMWRAAQTNGFTSFSEN